MTLRSPLRFLALLAAGVLALLACVSCSDGSSGTGTATATDAWARTSAAGDTTGAVYLSITGGATVDALVAVAVPAAVAGSALLHQTMTMSHGSGMADMTEMKPVSSLRIPQGKTVSLSPGGYHVMLAGPAKPLTTGQSFTMTLTFDKAGRIDVPVEVRAA